jgi:predicted lipase
LIQEFVRESNNIESIKKSNQKLFKELSMASPNGLVENFIDDDKHDIQCGITISNKNKRITVVFRGSDSLKDWLYNLRFNKKRLNNEEKVHYGYYNLLHQNNIRGRLVTNIKNILKIYSDYELFITGHSAGSGLAIIFGYCLSQDIKKQINIITFAAPRIGNLLFRKAFENKKNLKHYRITNEHDIVPGLPLFFDYHHVGNNIHLKRNSVEYYNNYSYSYFKFSLLNCFSIPDHCMYKHLINLINNPW